jgi:chromate transporter
VLQFVGFLAGYRADGVLGGTAASLLTLWVTFAPCFAWIFLGAPFVERMHDQPRLKGALAGVTAAVVGVIANLALWFGLRVIFGQVNRVPIGPAAIDLPVLSTLQPSALALAMLAAALIFGLKLGLAKTLAISAAAGLALSFLPS